VRRRAYWGEVVLGRLRSALIAFGITAATTLSAAAQPVAGTQAGSAIRDANALSDRVHGYHQLIGGWTGLTPMPPDYCRTLFQGEMAYSELRGLASRAAASDQLDLAAQLQRAADRLGDELDEEEEINYQSYVFHPCFSLLLPIGKRPYVPAVYGWEWTGFNFGFYTGTTAGFSKIDEYDSFTNVLAHAFGLRGDPLVAGVIAGYTFAPWQSNFLLNPFVSMEYRPQTINQTFTGGTFIGTTTHWAATAGVKAGFLTSPDVFVYGLTGVGVLNQSLNVYLGGVNTSSNSTKPGLAVGGGVSFKPQVLQGFGMPIALFVEYQYIWWQDSHLDRPAASPFFNYVFKREDSAIRGGLTFYLNAPSRPSSPATRLITK
jgi:opacity protein-like surface antigen